MRKIFLAFVAIATVYSIGIEGAVAGVMRGDAASSFSGMGTAIQQARLFCANRYTGRFLYWGRCRRRRVYYHHYYRPRVYCRNRYTHRFLHWGYC